MEKQRIFRQYQEHVVDDHNKAQEFARSAVDHLARDGVTTARRYAGFSTVKSAQTEVTVAPGRMYGPNDAADGTAVYARATSLLQSMTTYLAAASKRIVSVSVYGSENEIDVETRDFAVIANPDEPLEIGQQVPIEPDAVAMTRSRDAVLVFTQGAEGADPQPPAIPATHVEIARILLDTTQVMSVTMMTANEVTSTDVLDKRADALETFKDQIGPRVNALGSDLASLQNRVNTLGTNRSLTAMKQDLARLKESLRFPDTAADYGADFYLDNQESDAEDDLSLGYDAKVQEGIRFPDANADESEIALFSANDSNAAFANGLLLPKYADELKLATGAHVSSLGIGQYGYQNITMKQGFMSRSRLRYGGSQHVCSNTAHWNTADPWGSILGTDNLNPASQLYADGTVSTRFTSAGQSWYNPSDPAHEVVRYDNWWFDTWNEPFMYAETTDHEIDGAHVAQSFLVSNDVWATKLGIYIDAKAANEDIHIALCEMNAGVPNLERTIMKTALAEAGIVIGWNRITIPPTFLKKGDKYAVVLVSNANHQIGMASGQGYLEGTFYHSTDGIYYQGDLTKDMMLEVWGAKFNAPQVTIEFAPLNLDGGLRFIDILAEMWVPESAKLIWEIRPNGAGEWLPLLRDNTGILAAAPPLIQFRARFDGTRDMQAALKLTGSRVHISRPKTAFKHISTDIELLTPSDEIHVKVLLEGFDDTPHDHSLKLHTGVAHDTEESPDTVTTKLLDAGAKRHEREYVFNLAAPVTHFAIEQTGATNSAQNTFHVAERVHVTA